MVLHQVFPGGHPCTTEPRHRLDPKHTMGYFFSFKKEAMKEHIEQLKKKIENELYLKKLGIRLRELDEGFASFEMVMEKDLENVHGGIHGGAIFSLIDAAFEASSNSHGVPAVALSMNIIFHKAPNFGDRLIATSREINRTRRLASYLIEAKDSEGRLIATCQAVVYRKKVESSHRPEGSS